MNRKQKTVLARIVCGAVLLVTAGLIDHFFKLEWYYLLAMYMLPFATVGYDVLWRAGRNILHGQAFDENFLMGIATLGALATGQFAEAVFVMLFYQVGEFFQSWAVNKSRSSIAQLMDIRPDYANVEENGSIVQKDPEEIQIGSEIIVKPGERIPLDGVVTEGSTSINTAALTGESVPQDAGPGDKVISGCVNLNGLIKVRTTGTFEDSTVNRILELVEESASNKAVSEKFITRFARYYTPTVVICAVLLSVIPPIFIGDFKTWFMRALTFLVISCPCALVISVPLSFFGGIGAASKKGILVKGSCFLEDIAKCEIAVFDKTGTLTEGTFSVSAVYPEHFPSEEVVKYCAMAEAYSNHPIAASVKKYYGSEIDLQSVKDTEEFPGKGVAAKVEGKRVLAGNHRFLQENGIECSPRSDAGSMLYVAVDGVYAGCVVVADKLKSNAKAVIEEFKSLGCKTVMLTGDKTAAADAAAKEIGVDEVHSELLPVDKVHMTEELLKRKSPGGKLLFVGDGINDAPVLSLADVGAAMGGIGSDASVEAADIVIMDDDIGKLGEAMRISEKTLGIVKQNIVFAIGIKVLFLILGALGFSNMWMAVFADVGVSVIAVLNAMRTLR